jgi:hypothetical protein
LEQRKPHASIALLKALSRQIHAAQELVRSPAMRNPSEVIIWQAESRQQELGDLEELLRKRAIPIVRYEHPTIVFNGYKSS